MKNEHNITYKIGYVVGFAQAVAPSIIVGASMAFSAGVLAKLSYDWIKFGLEAHSEHKKN